MAPRRQLTGKPFPAARKRNGRPPFGSRPPLLSILALNVPRPANEPKACHNQSQVSTLTSVTVTSLYSLPDLSFLVVGFAVYLAVIFLPE
jgi:hypothetical protein